MPPIRASALARELRRLDPAERAAFVADLWTARGFETAVDGAVVVAERPADGPRRRIACGPPVEADRVDAVVTLGRYGPGSPAEDPAAVTPADLRELLLYAIDRETARALVEAHLGRPLVDARGPRPLRERVRAGASRWPAVTAVASLLVVALAIGAAAGTLPLGAAPPDVAPVPMDGGVTATPTPAPGSPTATAAEPAQGGGDLFRYPPGLGPSGVTSSAALAEAHRETLAVTAWELGLGHDRSLDLVHPFVRWRTAEQTVVRASPARYRFEVTGEATVENDTLAGVSYVDYGDGEANYRRIIGLHGNAYERTGLPATEPPGVFASVSAAYVERYLSTTESRVEPVRVENTTRTRVVATGTPTAMARTVANYTAIAVVDRRGVVRELTVEYTLLARTPDPTPNGVATPYASPEDVRTEPVATVRFTMRFAPVKASSLTAPSWYDDARNATAGTPLEPWPTDPAV